MKLLETQRLVLRPFRAGDGAAMFRNWAVHESAEASEQRVLHWAEERKRPSFYQWAIELRAIGEPIGSISVVRQDAVVGEAEIGYCIGRRWWGQGLTAEALRAVVRFLITEVGVNRVCARHDVSNPNSGRVMEKAGMTKEGVLRAAGRNNRGVVDMAVYSILAGECP